MLLLLFVTSKTKD